MKESDNRRDSVRREMDEKSASANAVWILMLNVNYD